jgi:hypothetical protein
MDNIYRDHSLLDCIPAGIVFFRLYYVLAEQADRGGHIWTKR